MTIELVPFSPAHITMLKNFGGQDDILAEVSIEEIKKVTSQQDNFNFTLMRDGIPLGCGGTVNATKLRGVAWAILQKTEPKDFFMIDRAMRWGMKASGLKRIEAYVDPRFDAALRWMKLLGFRLEHPYLPYYFTDGSGAMLWAWHPEE